MTIIAKLEDRRLIARPVVTTPIGSIVGKTLDALAVAGAPPEGQSALAAALADKVSQAALSDGLATRLPIAADLATLRALNGAGAESRILSDGSIWVTDGTTDHGVADDGVLNVVDAGGRLFVRQKGELVDARLFGVSTASTDNRDALNTAITTAATLGFGLHIVERYEMQGAALPVENVRIEFAGKGEIVRTNNVAENIFTIGRAGNITLVHPKLTGPMDPNAPAYVRGQNGVNTVLVRADEPKIPNVTVIGGAFRNFGDRGFAGDRLENVFIDRLVVENVGRGGIMLVGDATGLVLFSTIRNVGPGGGGVAPYLNAYGFSASCDVGNDRAVNGDYPNEGDLLVLGIRVDGVPSWTGLDIHAVSGVRFIGGHVSNCANAVFIGASSGTVEKNGSFCEVSGILMDNPSALSRGAVLLAPSRPALLPYGRGHKVTDNVIVGYGPSDDAVAAGVNADEGTILIAYTRDSIVENNEIHDWLGGAIHEVGVNEGCSVKGNRLYGGKATSGVKRALYDECSESDTAYSDNSWVHGDGTGTFFATDGGTGLIRFDNNTSDGHGTLYSGAVKSRFHPESTALVPLILRTNVRHDFGSVAAGGRAFIVNVPVAGANPSANPTVSVSADFGSTSESGLAMAGWVNGAGTVVVEIFNRSDSAFDPVSHDINITVIQDRI